MVRWDRLKRVIAPSAILLGIGILALGLGNFMGWIAMVAALGVFIYGLISELVGGDESKLGTHERDLDWKESLNQLLSSETLRRPVYYILFFAGLALTGTPSVSNWQEYRYDYALSPGWYFRSPTQMQ